MSQHDTLASHFFMLADQLDELSDSMLAKAVPSLDDEDWGAMVAMHLDTAYWILANEHPGSDQTELGFIVATNVYNDLLDRGYEPEWAWEAAGLDTWSMDDEDSTTTASALPVGSYVVASTPDGTMGGLVVNEREMIAFHGRREPIPAGVRRIAKSVARDMFHRHGDAIQRSWARRNAR